MLDLARPGLLLAGLLASLVPLALHLIARRPPERAALPTARFLAPDPRTSVRVRRRPTDPLLLALRMLLLALLGAAAAGPAWIPRQAGTAELVLLDRGAGMRGEPWRAAVDAARRTLLDPGAGARGELVLFDTAAVPVARDRLSPALFDSLAGAGPGSAPSRYAAALRAVPSAARGLRGADSVRVTLLSAPRGEGWSPGLARLRRAAWPGALRTPPLSPPAEGPPRAPAPRGTAAVLAPPGGGRYVAAALGATGWRVGSGADSAAAHVVLGGAPDADRLLAAVRRGATLLVSGDAPAALRDVSPWEPAAGTGDAGGTMVFSDGLELPGAARRSGGGPRAGAAVLAAWEDGRPAAAASRVGRGCVVAVATALEGGSLPLSAAYPRAVDRLLRGCEPDAPTGGAVPLDAGALSVLRGDGLPSAVPVSALGATGGGIPLGRWVLGAALLIALVETLLAYGRRRAA